LLKQPQYQPMPVEREVASIFCGTNGYLDEVPESEVARFESEFLQYLDRNHAELLAEIAETGLLGDELLETLHAAVKTFKENWSDTPPAPQPQIAAVPSGESATEEAPTEGE
jgi:F-type H+-transporting ATPase subunit alpha